MRIIMLIMIVSSFVFCDEFVVSSKECEATNNLKATKNSGNISTTPRTKYKILDHKPESLYIQIPSANPSGRWVKKECFLNQNRESLVPNKKQIKPTHGTPYSIQPKQSLLALSWHNGFCETHRNKVECKRGLFGNKEYGFVLHGLWPQPKNLAYCGVAKKIVGMDKNKQWSKMPGIGLSIKNTKDLANVMPAIASGLHNHEWYKHGTCSGMNSVEYFTKATKMTNEFSNSKLAKYINSNIGKQISINEVRNLANLSFGAGASQKISMICKDGLLTEIRLSIGNDNSLSSAMLNGQNISTECQNAIIDKAGWL